MKKRRCIFRLPFPDSLIRSDSTVSSCIGYETSKFEIADFFEDGRNGMPDLLAKERLRYRSGNDSVRYENQENEIRPGQRRDPFSPDSVSFGFCLTSTWPRIEKTNNSE